MAITSYNIAPYFDDYNIKDSTGRSAGDKNYLRILFQPGAAVQTRELNQMQSILQGQIDRLGSSFYREGEAVLDGESSFRDNIVYMEVNAPTGVTTTELTTDLMMQPNIEVRATGTTGGTYCKVLGVDILSDTKVRVFIQSVTDISDSPGETLDNLLPTGATLNYKDDLQFTSKTVSVTNTATIATIAKTGYAFTLSVNEGIYYVKGSFVHTPAMTRFWIKNGASQIVRGDAVLTISERIVTSAQDSTLLDNSSGSYNYAAPGADRYSIGLDIAFVEKNQGGGDPFPLLSIGGQSSNIYKENDPQSFDIARLFSIDEETIEVLENREKSNLDKRLAKRTFEESGNYTVGPFKVAFRNFLKKAAVVEGDGEEIFRANADPAYSLTDLQTQQPHGVTSTAVADTKFIVQVEPETAYVGGFRYTYVDKTTLSVDKARSPAYDYNVSLTLPVGNYIDIELLDSPNYNPVAQDGYSGSHVSGSAPGYRGVFNINADYISAQDTPHALQFLIRDADKTLLQAGHADTKVPDGLNGNVIKSIQYLRDGTTSANSPTATYRVYLGNKTTFTDIARAFPKAGGTGVGQDGRISDATIISTNESSNSIKLSSVNTNRMLFKLPPEATQRVTKVVYHKYKKYGPTTVSGTTGNPVKITLGGLDSSKEIFTGTTATDKFDYTVIRRVIGSNNTPFERLVNPEDYQLESASASSITISKSTGSASPRFFSSPASGEQFIVYAPIQVTAGVGETRQKVRASGTTVGTGDANNAGKVIVLDHCDVIKSTISGASGTMTSNDFTVLDDGFQDPEFYRKTKIILRNDVDFSSNTNTITYDYYQHGPGDFFTVNSYGDYTDVSPNMAIPYDRIPKFNGDSLANYIDFRVKETYLDEDTRVEGDATQKGPAILVPNRVATADFSYYMPRQDRIIINGDGEIQVIKGNSNINPVLPIEPSGSMTLYTYFVPAYTYDAKDIKSNYINNTRSTMKDIGRLRKRIDAVEQLSALTLLENQAMQRNFYNDDGTLRFKNGFLVDNFRNDQSANPQDRRYLAAMDKARGILRPYYTSDNFRLFYRFPAGIASNQASAPQYESLSQVTVDDFYVNTPANQYKFDIKEQKSIPTSGRPQEIIATGFKIGDALDANVNGIYVLYKPNGPGKYPEYRKIGADGNTANAVRRIIRTDVGTGDRWEIQRINSDKTGYTTVYYTNSATDAGDNAANPAGITTLWYNLSAEELTDAVTADALLDRASDTLPDSASASRIDKLNPNGQNNPELLSLWNGTTEVLFSQLAASRTVSVQPYEVTLFEGKVKLSPAGDEWVDTTRKPATIIQDNSAMAVLEFLANQTDILDDHLGTVWNHWETLSQGTEILSNNTSRAGNTFTNVIVSETTTEQERFGQTTTLESNETIEQSQGDKVVDINIVPFIRSRDISIYASGLKPNTRLYFFFDGRDVTRYVAATEGFRQYGLHEQVKVYTDGALPSTLEAPGADKSNSSALTSVTASGVNHYELPLYSTTETGEFFGTFRIPNSDDMRFRTGVKTFKITSSKIDKDSDADTIAQTTYAAYGLNQEVEETIVSTQVPELVVTQEHEQRTVVTQQTQVRRWRRDPIAQTFTIPETYKSGVCVTDIDVYFAEKPSFPANVEVYLVPTENGLPTNVVVPGTRVSLPASQVNVPENGRDETDPTKILPTNFKFDYPVYLKSKAEYALVVFSPSPDYRVWISELGGANIMNANIPITTNSDIGVLCKSQNAKTWSASQLQDLMFTMNKGVFKTSHTFEFHTQSSGIYGSSQQGIGVDQGSSYRNIKISAFNIASDVQVTPNTDIAYDIDFRAGVGSVFNNITRSTYGVPEVMKPKKTYELYSEIDTVTLGVTDIVVKCTMYSKDRGDGLSDITPFLDLNKTSLLCFQNHAGRPSSYVSANDSIDIQSARNNQYGYVTKNVVLADPADNLRILINTNRLSEGGNLEVMVKGRGIGDDCPWTDKHWEPAPVKSILGGEVAGLSSYSPSLATNKTQDEYTETEYSFSPSLNGITEYAIKIVFTTDGGDSAKIVRAKDLRVIATA